MKLPIRTLHRVALAPVLFLGTIGCQSTDQGDPTEPYLPPLEPPEEFRPLRTAWTKDFNAPRVAVAQRIEIVGPPQVVEHATAMQDPENVVYTVESDGDDLRHIYRLRPDARLPEVHGHMDLWRLVALGELVIVQRAGTSDVTVTLSGNALLTELDTGTEIREQSITRNGVIDESLLFDVEPEPAAFEPEQP